MVKVKLACEENEFIYEHLEKLRKQWTNSQANKSNSLKRILQALEKFPLPILSGKMAELLLQGVGPSWCSEIDKCLKTRPQKRKASPVQIKKRVEYIPEAQSAEWACLLCVSKELSICSYDIPYLTKKYFQDCELPLIESPSKVLGRLVELDFLQEEDGLYSLTTYGSTMLPQLSQCPTVRKPNIKKFDPDSWIIDKEISTQNEVFNRDIQIILIVDTAERLCMDFETITNRLNSRNLLAEKKKLWIGDYQWVCRVKINNKVKDLSLNILVERKTANDLAHSIVDFRYEEQKIKMKFSQATCFYLLEGTVPKSSTRISKSTLLNSILSTKINYEFQIKITKDSGETLNWLARMTHQLYEQVIGMSEKEFGELKTFEEFQSWTNPNDGRTVSEVFGRQLRALDNMGEHSTLAILSRFKTPLKFYLEIKKAREKGERNLNKFLKAIKLSNGNTMAKKSRDVLVKLFLG